MKSVSAIIVACIALTSVIALGEDNSPCSLCFHVLGETGAPLSQASIYMGFEQDMQSDRTTIVQGQTDTNGCFWTTNTTSGHIGGRVEKASYYKTQFTISLFGQPQPWAQTNTVVLREVKNPIAMYAKIVDTCIPAVDTPAPFDLVKGDWCVPYGQGIVTDFVFRVWRQETAQDNFDVSLTVSVPNSSNGLQTVSSVAGGASDLRLPHTAPETGYVQISSNQFGQRPQSGYYGKMVRDDCNFFFRVRSQTNAMGQLTNAWYGKIHGDIRVGSVFRSQPRLLFNYYLNPDGTRNVEFDPNRNLFPVIGGRGSVSAP